MSDPTPRPMTGQDIGVAARRHRAELPHGLFPMLGHGFLRGYYRSFVSSPYAVALVAPAEGEPTAHLVGTTDHHAHHRWTLRRHGLRLAVLGVVGLATHPDALRLFLRTRVMRYLRALVRAVLPGAADAPPTDGEQVEGGRTATEPLAVLMHVAVTPAARGTGLGRRLTEDFVKHAHAAGCREVRLVTRTASDAGGFYEALGWRRVDEHPRDGSVVTEYRYPPPESSHS